MSRLPIFLQYYFRLDWLTGRVLNCDASQNQASHTTHVFSLVRGSVHANGRSQSVSNPNGKGKPLIRSKLEPKSVLLTNPLSEWHGWSVRSCLEKKLSGQVQPWSACSWQHYASLSLPPCAFPLFFKMSSIKLFFTFPLKGKFRDFNISQ